MFVAALGQEGPAEEVRSEGLRLGLDAGFWRSSVDSPDRTNAGSPSLIPIGADASWRMSRRVLVGAHGHIALASRDDCLGDTECTGRGYGLGAHVEIALGSSRWFIPWFRYAMGWEMLHQTDAYRYRHAIDVLDVRFGGDFVVARGAGGRTTRIGPLLVGMIVGLALDEVSSGRGFNEPSFGSGHTWFVLGARGTTDW